MQKKTKLIKIFQLCFLLLISIFSVTTLYSAEPPNLGEVKLQLKSYYESGQYLKDVTQVALDAQNYLQQKILENKKLPTPQKLALILDIDETALSNFKDYYSLDFGGTQQDILLLVAKGEKSALAPILNLYRFAKSRDVAIFFISGRKQRHYDMTADNLKAAGYYNWDGLYLKPNNYNNDSVIPFKTNIRKMITEQGYIIIATIGDQKSDLQGEYTGKTFKIPNPFYLIP